jgi:adenylate kinase family enzyme
MKRVAVLGHGASGKSTLAAEIGNKLHIPVFHTDKLFWNDNWQYKSFEERQSIQNEVLEKETWVIDGIAPSRLANDRIKAADTVILLDMPRRIRVTRWLRRIRKNRGSVRSDMGGNNVEKFNVEYLRFLLHKTPNNGQSYQSWVNDLRAKYPEKTFVYLNSSKAVRAYVENHFVI